MKYYSSVFTLLLWSISTALLFPNNEGDEKTKSFKVNKGGNLEVSLNYGDIKIITWDKNEVLVEYEDEDYDEEQININQSGNTIEINSFLSWGGDITVSVPVQFNLNLETQGGDINVTLPLEGSVEVNTAGGNIALKSVIGSVHVSTSGGNIVSKNIKGDVEVNTYGGDIVMSEIDGKAKINTAGGNIIINDVTSRLEVQTAGGNVSVANVGSNAEISSGGGNISVGKVSGSVTVKTGGGNISLDGAKGETNVLTGGGNISLRNILGRVKAKSGAGNIYAELIPDYKDDNILRTGSGDIKLLVPEDSRLTINAKVGGVGYLDDIDEQHSIVSDFKATIISREKDKDMLIAKYNLNGGGANVTLETGNGIIEIRKLKK